MKGGLNQEQFMHSGLKKEIYFGVVIKVAGYVHPPMEEYAPLSRDFEGLLGSHVRWVLLNHSLSKKYYLINKIMRKKNKVLTEEL